MLIDDDGCMLWVELIVRRRERSVFGNKVVKKELNEEVLVGFEIKDQFLNFKIFLIIFLNFKFLFLNFKLN